MWTVSLDPSPESGYAPADVVIDAQPGASVGDLATALGRHLSGGRDGALVGPIEDGEPWPAARLLTECTLRSGDVLPVVSLPRAWLTRPARPARHRAVLRVVAGPDSGRSQVVSAGSADVGRGAEATLTLTDPLVSRRHTTITLGTRPTIVDEGSANGTLVDGMPISARTDIEWGQPFRLGDSAVTVEPAGPAPVTVSEVVRPPRFGEPLAEGVREIAPPPTPPRPTPLQWAMFALPLMLGGAMLMRSRSTYALAYMIGYPLVMVLSYVAQRRRQRKEHRKELAIWRADVDDTLAELDEAAAAQRLRAQTDQPELRTLAARVQLRGPALWERATNDVDFLQARAGIGPVAALLTADLKTGGDREAAAQARQDIALRAVLDELAVPLTVAVEDLVAITGSTEQVDGVARALLARLACDHSPADLAVTAVLGRDRAHHEAWLRWLPHASRRPSGAAPVAIGAADGSRLLESLLAEDDARGVTLCLIDSGAGLPRRLIEAAAASEAAAQGRLRLIWLGDSPETVPAATTVLLDLTASIPAPTALRVATRPNRDEPAPVAVLAHRARGGVALLTKVDELGLDDAWRLARAMHDCVDVAAVVPVDTALPDMIRLPDLVPDLHDADDVAGIQARWAARRGLRAQIGAGAGGTVSLDLREDGPHGLVAGTTGSGKSELLQSLICSLALNNPPERITFLLVDYKGGAAFRECADLPHTVGYITDLSPALVQRALTSLGAEITAREHLLERYAAKDLRALERDHPEAAPPSLLICVDEFAALTAEVPEFVDGMVNIAQRGRSLGMHLLLATQRPAGVVTANVRANTDLRIALRVSSTDDSNDVIDSPDAARITRRTPGRAWIRRTGHGTSELVQAAWVGAHATRPGEQAAVTVRPFSAAVAAASEQASTQLDPRTDLERLVTAISAAAAESGRELPAKPWLPALPADVRLDRGADGSPALTGADGTITVPRRSGVIPVGIIDRPAEQAQEPALLDFGRSGHLLAYGASGTGKTELLRSVAVAAMLTEPEPPSVYGIDFGGGALGMLASLPVVGAVIGESDLERVTRLLRMLRAAVADRNRLLASRGAADLDALAGAGVVVPRVYVLIDNLPSLLDALEAGGSARRQHAEILTSILQDGRRVGVHVIATAPRRTGVGSGMQAAFGQRLVLRMPTDDDYSMIGVPTGVLDPESPAGRALLGRHEVQVATVGGAGTPAQPGRLAELAAALGELPRAVGVPGMPTRLPQTLLPAPARDDLAIAVDADYVAPVTVPLGAGALLVAGRAGSGRSSLLAGLAQLARRGEEPPAETVLIGPRAGEQATDFDTVLTTPADVLDWLPDWRAKAAVEDGSWRLVCVDDMHVWERSWDSAGTAHDAVEALADFAAEAAALGVALVVAGDSDEARTRQHVPGVIAAVRRARHGILLSPELPDGSLLGVSVPMQTLEPMAGPGRGLLCERGTGRVVQVISVPETDTEPTEGDI